MTPEAFVAALDAENHAMLARLAEKSAGGQVPAELTVAQLLKLALKNELEATEIAAIWLADSPELDVKLALARQCGDEAKHYRWIEERLRALGLEAADVVPPSLEPSPMLRYLKSLQTTAERVAAGQFTREAVAIVRNEVFADWCDERGDGETAALYRQRIQPDERHHHELGRTLLLRYAVTEEAQAAARLAAQGTLRVAEEIQEMVRLRAGICRAPGC